MNTREQIINLLLGLNDQKDETISSLQKKVAELEKAAEEVKPVDTPTV